MSDRMLYLALAASIVGLLLITFVSPSVQPPLSRLSDVSTSSLEKVVRVAGNVSRVHVFKGGSTVLTVSDGASAVDVFMPAGYASGFGNVSFAGRRVDVLGTVQVYNGRLELVAEKPGSVRLR